MLQLFDTTLRDGAQAENISFSISDKLQIFRLLNELGIHYIEAGNPGANPGDRQLFDELIHEEAFSSSKPVAFGATCKPYTSASDDPALRVFHECNVPVKTIVGKSSLFHVINVLRCDKNENLRIISDSIRFLKTGECEIWFDAEHFFEGFRENPSYALKTLQAAVEAGASCVILCDTNGASFPEQISEAVLEVVSMVSCPVGVHLHNDCGLAVANSLAAIDAGCTIVQGTIGGIGERCGNTDLCTLLPILCLKKNIPCLPEDNLKQLTHLSRAILEVMNVSPSERAPFIGHSAFAHKGGMHIDAIIKDSSTYELINPESVGNQRRFLLSNQSGRAGVYARLEKLLPDLTRNSPEIESIIRKLKEKEAKGYTYENADGSFELLALDTIGRRPRFFEVEDYHVLSHRSMVGTDTVKSTAQAYLKIRVSDQEEINAAEGEGPVNALDLVLRKTLSFFFPSVSKMRLKDFKVRVLNVDGTASRVRVSIESSDGVHIWNTVGVSVDIIQASLKALIDSMDYMLTNYVPQEEIIHVLPEFRE